MQISNHTAHDITIKGHTLLGTLQLVQSITPVEVKQNESFVRQAVQSIKTTSSSQNKSKDTQGGADFVEELVPKVSLRDLTEEQKIVAKHMLYEERDIFVRQR